MNWLPITSKSSLLLHLALNLATQSSTMMLFPRLSTTFVTSLSATQFQHTFSKYVLPSLPHSVKYILKTISLKSRLHVWSKLKLKEEVPYLDSNIMAKMLIWLKVVNCIWKLPWRVWVMFIALRQVSEPRSPIPEDIWVSILISKLNWLSCPLMNCWRTLRTQYVHPLFLRLMLDLSSRRCCFTRSGDEIYDWRVLERWSKDIFEERSFAKRRPWLRKATICASKT